MYVASVFIWMLRLFVQWFEVFLGVFTSVSDACFKYFIFLHMYIVSIASECFKSRLSDAGKHSGGTGPYEPQTWASRRSGGSKPFGFSSNG
jgi:hypothetical protein